MVGFPFTAKLPTPVDFEGDQVYLSLDSSDLKGKLTIRDNIPQIAANQTKEADSGVHWFTITLTDEHGLSSQPYFF